MYDLRSNLPLFYDFYIVAMEKSYSKAAEKHIGVYQSHLSRGIKNLEDILGLKLVISNNKGIKLTLDGEKLFKKLDEIFNNFNEYKIDYLNDSKDIKGKITIGTTRNIADNRLRKYISKFIKEFPNVNIKVLTDSATNLNEWLMNHQIDVLIDYLPHINTSEKYEMEIRAISDFETCFACSKAFYDKTANKIRKLNELEKYDLVIPGSSRRRQALDAILQDNNIKITPKIEMPDSKLMAEFVEENDYIGYFIKEEIKSCNLVKLNLDIDLPINSIGIIYSKNTINIITKNFVELVLNDIEN